MSQTSSRFVLLPTRGFVPDPHFTARQTAQFLAALRPARPTAAAAPHVGRYKMEVVDTIGKNGPALVAMSQPALMALRRAQPGLRIVPEVFYPWPQRLRREDLRLKRRIAQAQATGNFTVKVVLGKDGAPVRGADVVAFTDFAQRAGASARTNAKGEATLKLPAGTKTVERLYIFPADSAWPLLKRNHAFSNAALELTPIDLAFTDSRVAAYPRRTAGDGKGVTVGVIDTGVGPHGAVIVSGGANTVVGEDKNDYFDADQHGTHVAGIIAGDSTRMKTQPAGAGKFRGVASGVTLRAYRVFGKDAEGASNFAIAKAIDQAVADGCDLLNLSLGGGPEDALTSEAIKAARAKGTVCVIAAGNDGGAVAFPGRLDLAVCVSALGKRGTWPAGAVQGDDLTRPVGKDDWFLASFSNRGPQVDLAGPGLGIISSVPGDVFAVFDGTSMACPAVCGAIARRLANHPDVLKMALDAARGDAIVQLAYKAAQDLQLPADFQGLGLAL
jgi:subtilisin family serine protease